jgi:hypothetical protein
LILSARAAGESSISTPTKNVRLDGLVKRLELAVFGKMPVEDESVRDWFRLVLTSETRDAHAESMAQRSELQRQETLLVQQQGRLLNMRLRISTATG